MVCPYYMKGGRPHTPTPPSGGAEDGRRFQLIRLIAPPRAICQAPRTKRHAPRATRHAPRTKRMHSCSGVERGNSIRGERKDGVGKGKRWNVYREWLCTPRRIDPNNTSHRVTGIVRDTNDITYRCFLPDLTRFVSACCATAGQNGPRSSKNDPKGGIQPRMKRISGIGHR